MFAVDGLLVYCVYVIYDMWALFMEEKGKW